MIRDITIGQFYPVDSPIHNIDARIKIISTIIYIVSLFFVETFLGYGIIAVLLGAIIKLSKVPLKFMLKGIKSVFIIIIFTAFINIFTTRGPRCV